jgi:hypothetical protein
MMSAKPAPLAYLSQATFAASAEVKTSLNKLSIGEKISRKASLLTELSRVQ